MKNGINIEIRVLGKERRTRRGKDVGIRPGCWTTIRKGVSCSRPPAREEGGHLPFLEPVPAYGSVGSQVMTTTA